MKIRLLISVVALAFAATAVNAADPVDLRGKKGVVDPNWVFRSIVTEHSGERDR